LGRRHVITIYTKPGCHLCDRAKELLLRCQSKANFGLEEADISQNPELAARYGNDIPVVLLDGREIARHVVRERKLLELLKQS
jgi:glutaredoxin